MEKGKNMAAKNAWYPRQTSKRAIKRKKTNHSPLTSHEKIRVVREFKDRLSELEKQNRELRASNTNYRNMYNNEIYAILFSDLKTFQIIDINDTFVRLYGYSREELLAGMTALDVTLDKQQMIASFAQVTPGKTINIPLRYHRKKDGSLFPVEIVAGTQIWGSQEVIFTIIHDISDRIQSQEQIHFQANLLAHIDEAVFVVDMQGRFTYINLFAEKMFERFRGLTRQQMLGANYKDLIFHENLKTYSIEINQQLLLGKSWKGEVIDKTKEGGLIYAELTASPVFDSHGKPLAVIVVLMDITGRKLIEEEVQKLNEALEQRVKERTAKLEKTNQVLAEKIKELEFVQQALSRSEFKYRIVAENTYDWEYWIDPQKRFIYISPACKGITGYSPEEFYNDPDLFYRIIYQEDRTIFENHEAAGSHYGIFGEIEYRIVHADGTIRWLGHACLPIFDPNEKFLGIRGCNRDITERKEIEEALVTSQTQLSLIHDNISDSLFNIQIDANGEKRFKSVNPTFLKTIDATAEQIVGKKVQEVFPLLMISEPQLNNKEVGVLSRAILERRTLQFERIISLASGPTSIDVSVTPIFNSLGICTNLIGIVHDITRLKQAEMEIQKQALRSEALVRTSSQINQQLDLNGVLDTICQGAVQALNVPAAHVIYYNEPEEQFSIAAVKGHSPDWRQRYQAYSRIDFEKYISQRGNAYIIPDLLSEPVIFNKELFKEMNFKSAMTASIILNHKPVGLITVFAKKNSPRFGQDDLFLLSALASQASQAINNAHLYQQVSSNRKRLSDLSQALVDAQETERRTLALELHDEFGQILSSIKMALEMITAKFNENDQAQFIRAQTLVKNLIDRVRRMSLDLRPSMLDDLGLQPAFIWLFRDYQNQTGEEVRFEQSGLNRRFPPQVEIVAYRFIQEALTNVIRHAGNKQVTVNAWTDETSLNLQIIDEGVGFNPEIKNSEKISSGLSGMRERTRLLGGELVIESTVGVGTTITLSLPITIGKNP